MPNPSKIHPRLANRMHIHAMSPTAHPLKVIVKYRAGAMAVAGAVDGVVATTRNFRLIQASAHAMTQTGVNVMSERDDVEMIWLDEIVHTMLDASVPLIGVPAVWQAGFTGKGIKVAIVDTGIDPNHPDFTGRIDQFKDFTGEGQKDNHGHGTHVAGIVGGTGAGSSGKYRGVAPDCSFYIAKVLRGDGSGDTSDVMGGVEWAVQQGAQVINLSLGSDGACDGTDALSVLCDAAVNKGAVMCIAAGNAGPGESTVGSPGCAKTVITIGATNKSDQVTDFSSRGPTSDHRVKPDVCFPGGSIASCRASGTSMGTPVNNLYTIASGTSMATPHAAGACALILQAKPGLTPQQVKDLLMNTAKNLGLPGNTQGKGRADVLAAFQQAMNTTPTPTPVPPTPEPIPPTPNPTPTPPPPDGGGCGAALKSILGGR